jgi:hypothetical protein
MKRQGQVTSNAGEKWTDYTRIDNFLSLNGSPRESEFRLELKHDDLEMQWREQPVPTSADA